MGIHTLMVNHSSRSPRTTPAANDGVDRSARRVILLGASNLTISFPVVLASLQSGLQDNLDVLAAMGHGRSYGTWSRVLARELPGIVRCGLWSQLDRLEPSTGSPLALITDVGNDVLYGASVNTIAAWLDACLQRLSQQGAEIVVTLLPVASVQNLSRWRYYFFRTLLFPTRSASWPQTLRSAHELNEQLRLLAQRYSAHTVEPSGDWYGLDPIHIRRRCRQQAWRQILSRWSCWDPSTANAAPRSHVVSRRRMLRPATRRVFGRPQITSQPVIQSSRLRLFLY